MAYFNPEIETLARGDLDALVDERISYTVRYAAEHSRYYRRMFEREGINPGLIREHEDLLSLPVIGGETIREHQPPFIGDFELKSVDWNSIFSIHETSGTSGIPKAFFLTWGDWLRYAEKYARIFTSQGFGPDDRVVVCASYGMNVGANTMTLAARDVGFCVIPEGRCTFPPRVITSYRPTAIVGSVFKLLRLARRLRDMGIDPATSGIRRLVVGGESFAPESRAYLAEVWGVDVYNTYGSTEGTMCGECSEMNGLHVPEDLVHMDLYDPGISGFVEEGECGRIVLTTLVPVGEKAGMVLINYDTEDTTMVLTRERCACGRTHMKILNPQREAETFWIAGVPVNRVDIERGVFSRDNMEYLTGEYEAFLYGGGEESGTVLRVSVECEDTSACDRELVEHNFITSFFGSKRPLFDQYNDGTLDVIFHFADPGALELYRAKGRPKRFIDRR
ncbi:MAG TPA: coenzyme F390 synthetase [Methanoculleus sp.]|nr:coenzyme F390 synthetase [Methanoculleus sp.]